MEAHTEPQNISETAPTVKTPPWNYKDPNHVPPFATDYTEMYAPENVEVTSITIGKDGCNLKKITEQNEIAYIYHNKESNKFEIWGSRNKFTKVQKQIQNHIDYATRLIQSRNSEVTLN